MFGSRAIEGPETCLEEFVLVRPVHPARVRRVLDARFRDVGQAVPAVLPLGALRVRTAVGIGFDVVGQDDGDLTAVGVWGDGHGVDRNTGWGLALIVAEDWTGAC